MSKGNSYWSTARGKIGDIVVSINKGQRIEKAYQPVVSNPKSTGQMLQRAKFANAVKFYKHANQALFKFAFEDKKQTESEYNAFMRHNINRSPVISKEAVNSTWPALGRWILTDGRFNKLPLSWYTEIGGIQNDNQNVYGDFIIDVSAAYKSTDQAKVTAAALTYPTIGRLSKVLKAYNSDIEDGDFITVVTIKCDADSGGAYSENWAAGYPTWKIQQFEINENSTESQTILYEYDFLTGSGENDYSVYFMPAETRVLSDDFNMEMTFAALVHSRAVDNSTYVSYTELALNSLAATQLTALQTDANISANLKTWGATGSAILKGAIVRGVSY